MDDSELERKAVEELLKEANRAKVRAQTMGPAGWMKCPLGSTNKRFLLNTLRSSALTRTSERGRDEHRYNRVCERHRKTDCEKCNHKVDSHRRQNSSHFHSSKHRSSTLNHSSSRSLSPSLSRKSDRSRSRSPVRDSSPDVTKYTDRKRE
ncbi:uncharacterized protein LOC143751891 [Siphateles boraxobius]|uniref:uncharacterized protein LOC143751891 n=1 Tax=Siphateles boraxobius TaxID=180520 RepID=UPI0040640C82